MSSNGRLVLGFDSSGDWVDAAIVRKGRVIAESRKPRDGKSRELLFETLQSLLDEIGVGWREISAFGTAVGPGYFNGIRVAVAAARGLSMSLQVPAIGLTAFDILAWGIHGRVLSVVQLPGGLTCCQMNNGSGPFFADPDEIRVPDAWSCRVVGHRADEIAKRNGAMAVQQINGPGATVALAALGRMGGIHPRPRPFYVKPPRVDPGAARFAVGSN